jgi:predicted DNA-binding transcriptional regulator AlpA
MAAEVEQNNELWDVRDVARYLRCNVAYVYWLANKRGFPRRKLGRLARYDPAEVKAWFRKHSGEPR